MDAKKTGALISQLRKERGYTQKDLAELLHVSDKAISRWETGKGYPDTALLKPLSDALGIGVSELLADRINAMDEESYQQYLKYHFYCCEKPEMLGHSNHFLFVGKI